MSKGAPDGASWHEGIAETATLTECLEHGGQNLFSLPDYLLYAQELQTLTQNAKTAAGIFGKTLDKTLVEKARAIRASLALTRVETLLLRLFQPDQMAKFTPQERDDKVRALKAQCVVHAKWPHVFKPLFARALDAMKRI